MRSEPLVYLTYGDVDSPVFRTQVIAFCSFLEEELQIPVRLVSFVPLRLYFSQRRALKSYERDVCVFPVINRIQGQSWYSRFNAWIVSRFAANSVMTRNPIAAHVCISLARKGWKYFYDARGCNYKELKEFSGVSEEKIEQMKEMERLSFHSADWIYSVSEQLILHFKDAVRYRDHNHSVVPCCRIPESVSGHSKVDLFGTDDITVFCYAGALSVWNFPRSFEELSRKILKDPRNRLIILSHQIDELDENKIFESKQCIKMSVSHREVSAYLQASDYGILLRKKAVTNQVASPSKFADYMGAGCKVIISPEIGDFTDFVVANDCGLVYRGKKDNQRIECLGEVVRTERERIKELSEQIFTRSSEINLLKYRNLKRIHDGHTN